MRSTYRTGMMVAAVALLASGSSALAADPTIDSLQQQINALSQQLNALKAAPPAAPAAAPVQGAPTIPSPTPGFLQYGSSVGGFVIPGTKTALKVGGDMNVQFEWDKDAGAGSAGGDSYSTRAGTLGSTGGYALPGTAGARQSGRFSANATYSRLNFETRTPSEYGEIKFYTEIDFAGSPAGGNEYNSTSHTVRLRHAYGTIGNFTVGQTWTLWTDRATLTNSVLNNGPAGYESGVRQPVFQYRWDIDPAQKNQLYFSAETPYSDFQGADSENLTGNSLTNPTNFNTKVPDFLVRYAHNDSWGRYYLTGLVRDISINTVGQNIGSGAGSLYTGSANDSTIGWGVTTGAKVYTGLGNAKNAAYARLTAGQGIGRYMNFNSATQNASAVLDSHGKLQSIYEAGYQVGYQHFFDAKNIWQANVIWSDQKQWQKNSLMSSCSTAGSVCGENGLPLRLQNIELNFQWSPNSYVATGPAYTRSTTQVAKGLNLVNVAGATRATSGTTAEDNRFLWTTNIGF